MTILFEAFDAGNIHNDSLKLQKLPAETFIITPGTSRTPSPP